ncbi:hypothetical protein [Legionella tunisiensis]|uniref:hypothetical protein n=1 Tax=Legionella tunisiensis TaxID=1034944 RepID=UPI0002D7704B|nr:hypothetical protein [Legionella tunisiensis]
MFFFEYFECHFNPEDSTEGHFQYDEETIVHFASQLKGTNVTRIIGIEHPELTKVLQENMAGKKDRMIALGQGASEAKLNMDVIDHIVSYTSKSKSSGQTGDNEDEYGTWASETAKAAFSHRNKREESRLEQTGSPLSGETRHTFFHTQLPLNLTRDKTEAQQTAEPLSTTRPT